MDQRVFFSHVSRLYPVHPAGTVAVLVDQAGVRLQGFIALDQLAIHRGVYLTQPFT
jgi:hypothetical protein